MSKSSTGTFTPIIFLKKGCIYCMKLMCFIADANLSNVLNFDYDTKANRMMIQRKLGKVSFPCMLYKENMIIPESQDIMHILEADYDIDISSDNLKAFTFFTENDDGAPAMCTKYVKMMVMAKEAVGGDVLKLTQQLSLPPPPQKMVLPASAPTCKLAIFGATGRLGQRVVSQALLHGYQVVAIVRSIEQGTLILPSERVTSMHAINILEESNFSSMVEAVNGCDIVMEVVDNADRVAKVTQILKAVEAAKVPRFIICGGAGALKVPVMAAGPAAGSAKQGGAGGTGGTGEYMHMYEKLNTSIGAWLKPVTLKHLEAQRVAFSSSVPTVAQICPPGMVEGAITYSKQPVKDVFVEGVHTASYDDVAYVVVQALPDLDQVYNRGMIGLAPK